jgi:hypothetical protein
MAKPEANVTSNIRVVDIAPLPIFAAFRRLNERVLGGVEVAARVAILRRVAAAHVTAFQAHAQMDPRVSQLQAFFAAFGVRLDFLEVVFDVNARCRHENPPRLLDAATPICDATPQAAWRVVK